MSDYGYGADNESDAWARAYQASHPLGEWFDELAEIRVLLPKAKATRGPLAELAVLWMEFRLLEIENRAHRRWTFHLKDPKEIERCRETLRSGITQRVRP